MNETIAHYETIELLGTGGAGTVYRARDTRVGRTVALRVLGDRHDPADRARRLETTRAFTEISHPHVATLYDVGQHDGHAYLVYEFVPGERLAAIIAGRPMNLRRAIDICTQVADGLAEGHALELAHGALTPTSIAVTPKGHVKLLDFGLSVWQPDPAGQQTAVRLARHGAALGAGAVAYLAPEQILGQPADHRADVFALGVILYEMLTGRQPFDAPNASEIAVRIAQTTPPPPSRLQADVPPAVDAIVARAIAKSVTDRYENVALFAADLRAASSLLVQRESTQEMAHAVTRNTEHTPLWRTALLLSLLVTAIAVAAWTTRGNLSEWWHQQFGAPVEPVVAVMPFAVEGDDDSRPYLGPGVAEEVAQRLGQLPGVTVKGRTVLRSFSGRPVVAVAADVKAAVVLTGTVRPGPEGWSTVEVRVELASGADGRSLWSERYAGPARDIAAIEARVARDVSTRINVAYEPSPTRDRALLRLVNPDAYDTYLQAHDAQAAGDTVKATTLYENAIQTDPSLIEAQAALVEVLYRNAAFDATVSYSDVQPRMQQLAEEAETADPDLAPVQLALGLAAPSLKDSFGYLRRAIELDPSSPRAYLAVADVLRDVDPARAMRFASRAAELDPPQALATYQQASASLTLGQYAETLATVARGQAQDPAAPWWDALRQRVLLVRPGADRGAAAAAAARSASDFAPGAFVRAASLAGAGQFADATNVLGIVTRVHPGFCEARALLAAITWQAGNRSEAVRLANEVERAARTAPPSAAPSRCAALAAAGIGDTARTAFWLGRAAGDERALRHWNATNVVLSAQAGLRQRMFPWGNVVDNTAVAYASARIESALVRARADAAKAFQGLDVPVTR